MPLAALIAQLGPGLRCQACGSTDIHARPDWPKIGQVTRHTPWPQEEKAPDEAEADAVS